MDGMTFNLHSYTFISNYVVSEEIKKNIVKIQGAGGITQNRRIDLGYIIEEEYYRTRCIEEDHASN